MFSIDGLVTGLDTTSIIDGLVSIQQSQIDRLNSRKQEIQFKQAAFKGIEAQLVALQGALRTLSSSTGGLFDSKTITTSDESIVTASADKGAVNGTFSIRVDQLAQAEQLATQQFTSSEAIIPEGTFSVRVGSRSATSIVVDDQNKTLQGLADSINDSGADVTASILNDGNGSRLLLTSKFTGEDNSITIDNQLGPGANHPDFSGPAVQDAANAEITVGSGPGAIVASSSTNVFSDVFEGVTLKANTADPSKVVTIDVGEDSQPVRDAIDGFVESFNQVVGYIESQSSFDAENEIAGPLLGYSPASGIQRQLQDEVSRVIPNLNSSSNRLSSIGVTFNDKGRLQIDSEKLDKAISGESTTNGLSDIKKLFTLDGQTDNANIDFILGSNKTQSSSEPYQVVVTRAAQRANVSGNSIVGGTIEIDSSNNQFSIDIDGVASGNLTLANGTYTVDEMASHLQDVISQSTEFSGQEVAVSNDNGSISIESRLFGSKSDVSNLGGTALNVLQLESVVSNQGADVAGYFTVDGITENAIGKGRVLTGESDNQNTSGIQLKVSLTSSQLVSGAVTSSLTVTRGIGSKLSGTIDQLIDTDKGKIQTSDEAFDLQVQSVDNSISRITSIFEAKRDQLIQEFLTLETNVSQLRNQSSFLASQLGGAAVNGFGS